MFGPVKRLTHMDEAGRPTMVDVGDKAETDRIAEAVGILVTAAETIAALERGEAPKGDPLVVARIAGIQAAKRTAELIPLCHQLPLTRVDVRLDIDPALPGVRAHAEARVVARTGVEMEALTAVTVALLTLYDMLKAIDRDMRIEGVRLTRKSGGRSGDYVAADRDTSES
ncbi:MAG: cyclic pyranopterin monophosphate synthase MoaC [Gemmatimonadota bacterium]